MGIGRATNQSGQFLTVYRVTLVLPVTVSFTNTGQYTLKSIAELTGSEWSDWVRGLMGYRVSAIALKHDLHCVCDCAMDKVSNELSTCSGTQVGSFVVSVFTYAASCGVFPSNIRLGRKSFLRNTIQQPAKYVIQPPQSVQSLGFLSCQSQATYHSTDDAIFLSNSSHVSQTPLFEL